MGAEGKTSWRVFCAIELPEDLKRRAGEHAARLREAHPDARASWERPEKLHVTLKFLGEIERLRVEALSEAAAAAVEGFAPFPLGIAGAGSFPPRGLPRVLWLGVEDESGALARLHRRLEDECHARSFPREQRAFSPHLTIARLRSPDSARPLAEAHCRTGFGPHTLTVSELTIVRSELGPGGSRYTVISTHGF